MPGPTFQQIEAALDTGELLMLRPHGDYVYARRRGKTFCTVAGLCIPVWMEAEVQCTIASHDLKAGFKGFRIILKKAMAA